MAFLKPSQDLSHLGNAGSNPAVVLYLSMSSNGLGTLPFKQSNASSNLVIDASFMMVRWTDRQIRESVVAGVGCNAKAVCGIAGITIGVGITPSFSFAPFVYRLGHWPFTSIKRVRLPHGVPKFVNR